MCVEFLSCGEEGNTSSHCENQLMDFRRSISRIFVEALPPLLPYFFVAIIAIGALTGNRAVLWLGIGLLATLGAFTILFGLWFGVIIPIEIVRRWPTLTTQQKLCLGPIAALVACGIVLVFVAVGLMLMEYA